MNMILFRTVGTYLMLGMTIVCFIICLCSLDKKKTVRISLALTIASFAAFVVLSGALSLAFAAFDTPEAAIEAVGGDRTVVSFVGDDSCMVVTQEDASTYEIHYIKKTERGYVSVGGLQAEAVASVFDGIPSMEVYRIRDTEDYYAFATVNHGSVITILDENGGEIGFDEAVITNEFSGHDAIYMYLEDYSLDCTVLIDGTEITLLEGSIISRAFSNKS